MLKSSSIFVASVSALAAAAFEAVLFVKSGPNAHFSAIEVLPAMAVSLIAVASVMFIWLSLVSFIARRNSDFAEAEWILPAAVGAVVVFSFLAEGDRLNRRLLSPSGLEYLVILGLAGLSVSLGVWFVTARRPLSHGAITFGGRLLLGIPIVLFWVAVAAVGIDSLLLSSVGVLLILTIMLLLTVTRSRWVVGGCWVVVLISGTMLFLDRTPFVGDLPEENAADSRIRKVVLLSVDTLRWDALRHMNELAASTPNLDALAADSVVFEKAYAGSAWTVPSIATMLTGLPSGIHQTLTLVTRLAREFPTIASILQEAGFLTVAVVENPNVREEMGFFHGFDQFAAFPRVNDPVREQLGRKILRRLRPRDFPFEGTKTVTDTSLRWLRENHDRDFFLWVHYYDPHAPHNPPDRYYPRRQPPPEFAGQRAVASGRIRRGISLSADAHRWVRSMYEAEVRYVDEEIGRFLSELKDDGIYDELLLVFTSDHGEEFWEHYGYSHGHAMYDEVVHIPMMVKLPGNSPTGRVGARVSNGAVLETVLDLCGLSYTSHCYDPPSLSDYLTAANGEPTNATLSPTGAIFIEPQETLLLDDYKYLHWLSTGRERVFDLRTDPDEKRPLQYDRPELVEEMRAALEAIRERENEIRSCFGPTDVEVTPGEGLLKRLRSIGYIR